MYTTILLGDIDVYLYVVTPPNCISWSTDGLGEIIYEYLYAGGHQNLMTWKNHMKLISGRASAFVQ